MRRLLAVLAMSVLMLSGCGSPAAAPGTASSAPLLARFGLADRSAEQIVDQLDRSALAERPADLKVSVRPNELVVSSGDQKSSMALPADRFYLSVAPYVDHTHECFYHSLTTCKGELGGAQVRVRIVDSADKVLVDEARTTYANGFVGFWLPKGIEGTLRIAYAGKAAESKFSTGSAAPTCLTTLRLT